MCPRLKVDAAMLEVDCSSKRRVVPKVTCLSAIPQLMGSKCQTPSLQSAASLSSLEGASMGTPPSGSEGGAGSVGRSPLQQTCGQPFKPTLSKHGLPLGRSPGPLATGGSVLGLWQSKGGYGWKGGLELLRPGVKQKVGFL